MRQYLPAKTIAAFALMPGSQFALANTTVTLGDQDFADGATMNIVPFTDAGTGEPAPFGLFIGGDTSSNFSAS